MFVCAFPNQHNVYYFAQNNTSDYLGCSQDMIKKKKWTFFQPL